jgi:thiamine-phosphate pyrophosphorylase
MTEACRLYLITPENIDLDAFALTLTQALDAGDVACVQLRLKGVDDDAVRAAAQILAPIAQARDVAFLMNDRPDLAAETGCDGVHLGQQDAAYAEARATKDAIGHPDVEILSWWSELMTIPSVAIGGITPANCPPLVRAGADFIAVLSAVWNHAEGPGEAVKLFNRAIVEAAATES